MTDLTIYDLTCEYQTNPLGLGEPRPRLAWKLRSSRRGARQVAYRLHAAASENALTQGDALLWDTGRINSDESIQIPYQGPPLHSGERIWWRVQVWDEAGNLAESDPAWWEMGLLQRADWEPAQWIAGPLVGGVWTTVPLPFLRREFQVQGNLARARLYATALGLYECWINGTRVGLDWFTPGWTDYHKRVQYQGYDVTSLLQTGENIWGAVLGDGWYCGHLLHAGRQAYGDRPKFFAKLVLMYADGSEQAISTDDAWRVHYGALLGSDNYNGESYDARLEQEGWNEPGYDARRWLPVELVADPGIALSANFGAPVRTIKEFLPRAAPKEISDFSGSVWIYDFGQEIAGRVRLRVRGQRGETIRLRFAEMLNPDGTLYTANLRSARQTDTYTLKGNGEEVWEPRFTFHGFRYVELSGSSQPPTREMLTAVAMHSQMRPTGSFACSDPLVNQLQHNIVWGQKSNFFDVPTDCPFRDERLGWTGDAQLFMRTAAFNMDIAEFFYKWLRDLVDAQSPRGAYPALAPRPRAFLSDDGGPAWGDAGVICPWTLYLCYGDTRILERNYDSMQRFFQYLESTSENHIRPRADDQAAQGFGDWMALDGIGYGAGAKFAAWQGGTPKALIGTAFFAHSADLLARIARVLDRPQDAAFYQQEFETIRHAFIQNFVSAEGVLQGNTQTGYVLALHFNLLPDALRKRAVNQLVALIQARGMHLATGFIGSAYLAHTLTEGGRTDVDYTLLLQRTYPSWLFPVLNGATTIWERWDGWTPEHGFQDPSMNSFNHVALGAIGDWLYQTVAGIETAPDHPGYKHILLRPRPGALPSASATYESLYGTILSKWSKNRDKFEWDLVIPPNTTATVFVPSKAGESVEGELDADERAAIEFVERLPDSIVYRVIPGTYHFQSRLE